MRPRAGIPCSTPPFQSGYFWGVHNNFHVKVIISARCTSAIRRIKPPLFPPNVRFASPLHGPPFLLAMSKVKLPSISELTSHPVLPKTGIDTLPLLLIFRALAPVSSQKLSLPPSADLPQPRGQQPEYHPPAYQYYSYGQSVPSPAYYQNPYYPYYQGQTVASAPLQSPMYSVPEVINKPMNKCHRCGTTETPEWRRGPNGLRTLCNACGLFHAKLVKRKGAALAAEEVLNNKVCKGKNGRRILIKKQAMVESKKRMTQAQVTEIPPIPYPGDFVPRPHMLGPLPALNYTPGRMALPPPVLSNIYQPLPALRN